MKNPQIESSRSGEIETPREKQNILYVECNVDGTIGGSHISLLNLIRGLDKTRYRPIVVFYERHRLCEEYLTAGAELHILKEAPILSSRMKLNPKGGSTTGGALVKMLTFPATTLRRAYNFIVSRLLFGLLRSCWFLRRNRIDLLHLNNGITLNHEWMVAAKLMSIRRISHERGLSEYSTRCRVVAGLLDAIISISNAVSENLEKQGIRCARNLVIYNAVPDELFDLYDKPARSNGAAPPDHEPLIGIIGNIKPWKGQKTVIEAVALLVENYPKLRCMIVGSAAKGSNGYLDELKSLVIQNSLQDNVSFTGYRSDATSIISNLDVVVHASIDPEPFGRVIVEGMALGKPVIATNMGGPTELIKSGDTGILVPPNDPIQLADAIDQLLSNRAKALEIGSRAHRAARERFGIRENVGKTEALYETLLTGSK